MEEAEADGGESEEEVSRDGGKMCVGESWRRGEWKKWRKILGRVMKMGDGR